jgi:hypothetical protein
MKIIMRTKNPMLRRMYRISNMCSGSVGDEGGRSFGKALRLAGGK